MPLEDPGVLTPEYPADGACLNRFLNVFADARSSETAMRGELRLEALGRLELAVDGRPVDGLAAKAQALLIYLAIVRGAHSRSALAGLLWSDMPEETARANLRLTLTKLRKAVPDQLAVTRESVALSPDVAVRVDALDLCQVADQEDPGELRAALDLYRGDFLRDLSVPGAALFEEWAAAKRADYRSRALAAMDRLLRQARDAEDLGLGVEVARRVLEIEPWREEAHRSLIWFLARAGQRTAALDQYETCRRVLAEELGVEPAAATVALRDEVARGGEEPRVRPPAAAQPPQPLTSLIGREGVLATLGALLDDPACRLLTLVGPGGIGKTRLAVELRERRGPRYREGAVFASFVGTVAARPSEAQDLVVSNLAAALGISLAARRDPLDLLADHLAGREQLVVLDNVEQLREGTVVLAELLRRAPGLQLLATSRRTVGLGAERVFEVPALGFPAGAESQDLERFDAVRLFVERARLVRPGFRLTDRRAVARICAVSGGIPLAVELAARWVRSTTPEAIAERLVGDLDLLATSAPDVEPRHRSLRSIMDWSWGLLGAEERQVLARLSVFRGGFDLAAAAAVAAAGLPVLAGLVDHSLLQADHDGRYGLHELLREYAAEHLSGDEAADAQRRHAEHYAAALRDGHPDLDVEAENLRAATEWVLGHAGVDALDDHLDHLWPHLQSTGRYREAQAILSTALGRADVGALERGRWHRLAAEAHLQLGEAAPSRDQLGLALAVLGHPLPASTPAWAARLAVSRARQALHRVRPAAFRSRSQAQQLRAAEAAHSLAELAEVFYILEEPLSLFTACFWGLNQAERSGRADLIARNRASLGLALEGDGKHRAAARAARAATAEALRVDDPVTLCLASVTAGLTWIGVAEWAAADAACARGLDAVQRIGIHRAADQLVLLQGVAAYLTGRRAEATDAGRRGADSGRRRGDPIPHLWGLLLGIESALRFEPADQRDLAPLLDEARGLLPRGIARIDRARFDTAVARLQLEAGDHTQAWRSVRTAAELVGTAPTYAQYTLEGHAGVLEVCLALREGDSEVPEPTALRTITATAARNLQAFARAFPIARPRSLTCAGWSHWLDGRHAAAIDAWVRAAREADRLAMPYELARAHHELGRHLPPGQRSPLGMDRSEHLTRAEHLFPSITS